MVLNSHGIPLDLSVFQQLILQFALILSFGYGLFHFAKNRGTTNVIAPNKVEQNLTTGELRQFDDQQDDCSFSQNFCYKRYRYEGVEKDITANQAIIPAHGTSKFKLFNDHKMEQITLEQTRERGRHLEKEVEELKNEIELLQSERDEWAMRTEFVCRRLQNLMIKYDENQIAEEARIEERIKQEQYIKMMESECAHANWELQREREHVQRLTLEREENKHVIMIKVEEARVAEMKKREKYIQLLKIELAKMKRGIEEQRKHDESKQLVMRKVEELGQDLENARNDLTSAISRAEVAEEQLSVLQKKIKLADEKLVCAICLNNEKDMAFGCGHMTCRDCGLQMSTCPLCREKITRRVRVFPG